MPTLSKAVLAIARVLAISHGHASHVARAAQAARILPTGAGPVPVRLSHEQVATLLLGVLSGVPLNRAADTARRFAALEIDGIDFSHALTPPPTLGRLLANILAGAVPGVRVTLDVDAVTAIVTGVGDVPLTFGTPVNTGRPIRRTASLSPRALHALSLSIQQ